MSETDTRSRIATGVPLVSSPRMDASDRVEQFVRASARCIGSGDIACRVQRPAGVECDAGSVVVAPQRTERPLGFEQQLARVVGPFFDQCEEASGSNGHGRAAGSSSRTLANCARRSASPAAASERTIGSAVMSAPECARCMTRRPARVSRPDRPRGAPSASRPTPWARSAEAPRLPGQCRETPGGIDPPRHVGRVEAPFR